MKAVGVIVLLLLIVGGLNWGAVGLFDYNLVDEMFGAESAVARTVYVLVGLAAAYKLIWWVARWANTPEAK